MQIEEEFDDNSEQNDVVEELPKTTKKGKKLEKKAKKNSFDEEMS